MEKNKHQLLLIQYLRALAVLMIVIHHAKNFPIAGLSNPLTGYNALTAGVDIFFAISGFIMFVAARHEAPSEFLKKRIIRVVPLYWCATLALAAVLTHGKLWEISGVDIASIVKSLLFVPHFTPSAPDKILPYLVPGWTLNYEMFFYLLFFIGLLFQRLLLIVTGVAIVLVIAGQVVNPAGAALITYTDPIMLKFLMGFWIGFLYVKGYVKPWASILLYIGLVGLLLLPFFHFSFPKIYLKSLFVAFTIFGAVAHNESALKNSFLKLLGDASYSIYLTHMVFSLRIAKALWLNVPMSGLPHFFGWLITSLLISLLVGVFVYLYFEKPILTWLKNKWLPKNA